jgi:AraC family transcriptional regulator
MRLAAATSVPVTTGSLRFRALQTRSMRLTSSTYPAGACFPAHRHSAAVVSVMLDGDFETDIGARQLRSQPGVAVVEPVEEQHAHRVGTAGARTVSIEVLPDGADDLLGELRCVLDVPRIAFDGNALMLASRLRAEIDAQDRAAPIAAEGLALELLAALARGKQIHEHGAVPPWLRTVRELVHESVPDGVSIGHAARVVGLHPVHVARVFHALVGDSFGSYQRALRVRWAAQAIAESDEPLASIALRAGFADQSHFTRMFRRLSGMTPRSYRLLTHAPQGGDHGRPGIRPLQHQAR